MTPSRAAPIFRASAHHSVAPVALCSLTATRATAVYTNVHCPVCAKRVMGVPGHAIVEVRVIADDAERSGRGRVVKCHRWRCMSLLEVIEHR